jgi:predicted PurR-regulated permease PerM
VALGIIAVAALDAITPFIVGLILVYLLAPAVDRLEALQVGSRHLPRALTILVLYAAIVLVLVVGGFLILRPLFSQLQRFAEELPAYQESLVRWYAGLSLPDWVRAIVERAAASLQRMGADAEGFDPTPFLPIARSLAGAVAAAFGYLVVPVWAFYVLKDSDALLAGLQRAIPSGWRDDASAVLAIVDHTFGRWIRGQVILGLVVGTATFLGLLVLGELVDPVFLSFAVLLAVIAGLLELLPIIGPIISMVPTLLLAVTTADPLRAVIAVIILYVLVQQIENNVLVPKIQGDAVELHPAVVIGALIVGGAIMGILGAILALPVTAAARDVYRYLFRRLSEDDPDVPHPDAPDLARKTGRPEWPGSSGPVLGGGEEPIANMEVTVPA